MSSPLTKSQKAYIAQLANRAYAMAVRQGWTIEECGCHDSDAVAFRHSQIIHACGQHGLRCCSQDHYARIKGQFLALLGEPAEAVGATLRDATNPKRVAMYKLQEACREAGVELAYADRICRAQTHGRSLDDVDDKSLWRLVFTIRNRAAARRKQASRENLLPVEA